MAETTDYGPTIADLERKRDEIDRTIAMLRAFAGLPSVDMARTGPPGGPVEFTNKHFFKMATPDAILLYLESVKEARAAARITSDLLAHGFITTSSTPSEVIRTALRRLEDSGKVVQVKKEWGLPEWYPGLRGRIQESRTDAEPRKASRSTPAKKAVSHTKAKKDKPATPVKLTAYNTFLKEKMGAGMSMLEAATAWKKQKGE